MVPVLASMAGLSVDERVERRAEIDEVLAAWLQPQMAKDAAQRLLRAGIPAATLATSRDLVASDHLHQRGFWEPHDGGVLPGLPWQASFERIFGAAPALGADTEAVLREVLDFSPDEIAALRRVGAFG